MGTTAYYDLTQMTWPEIEQAMHKVKIAIIPIGAHEQHGPHMTENCDAVLAEEMARRLAARLHPEAIITPTVNMGISPHHMSFPGTITLRSSTLVAILRDMVESLKHHGLKHVLFLNSHGGNIAVLKTASDELSRELDMNVLTAQTSASVKPILRERVKSQVYGHSCEWEVSEAMYLAPHIVREDKLEPAQFKEGIWEELRGGNRLSGSFSFDEITANGCLGDATQASASFGEEICGLALDHLSESIRKVLEARS